jgi:hypothetical protein
MLPNICREKHLILLPIKDTFLWRVLVIQSHSYVKLMDYSFQCLIRRNQVLFVLMHTFQLLMEIVSNSFQNF